jgi:hypothetical protein
MKHLLLLLLGVIIFTSCKNDSIKTEVTDFNGVKIALLFEKDGCKMYRFKDGLEFIYWSDCRGKVEYEYTTKTGKSSETHKVQTINDRP